MDTQTYPLARVSARRSRPARSPTRPRSSIFGSSAPRRTVSGESGAIGTRYATSKRWRREPHEDPSYVVAPAVPGGGNSGDTSAHAASVRFVEHELSGIDQYHGTYGFCDADLQVDF